MTRKFKAVNQGDLALARKFKKDGLSNREIAAKMDRSRPVVGFLLRAKTVKEYHRLMKEHNGRRPKQLKIVDPHDAGTRVLPDPLVQEISALKTQMGHIDARLKSLESRLEKRNIFGIRY